MKMKSNINDLLFTEGYTLNFLHKKKLILRYHNYHCEQDADNLQMYAPMLPYTVQAALH